MSRCATLALILSVTACEHAQPMTHSEPRFEAATPARIEPAPARPVEAAPPPTTEPAVAPVAPAPAPKAAPKPAPVEQSAVEAPKKKLVKKCNPMSRAGCRWSEDVDERWTPRVTKQPADTTVEGSAP